MWLPKKQTVFHKITMFVLVFSLLFSSSIFILPQKAEAQWSVNINSDTSWTGLSNWVSQLAITGSTGWKVTEDLVLNKLATQIAKTMLQKMTGSIINWINTGFQGKPSFLTDPNAFFRDIAKEQTNIFIIQLVGSQTNNPYALDIAYSILNPRRGGYSLYDDLAANCRLRGGGNTCPPDLSTPQARDALARQFVQGNFGIGGWGGWYSLTQYNKNNIYGAYLDAQYQLAQRQRQANGNAIQDLTQSGGFLSFKKCVSPVTYQTTAADLEDNPTLGDTITGCDKYETQTPGKAVADMLGASVTSPTRQGELADTFWKSLSLIVDAFVNQVTMMGIRSLSDTAAGIVSGGGGQPANNFGSFTSQLINTTNPAFADRPTPGVSTPSETILQDLSTARANEVAYGETENRILTTITTFEDSLSDLNACYLSTNNTSGTSWITTIIRNNVSPIKTPVVGNIALSTRLVAKLDDFKQRVNSATTPSALLTVSQEFYTLNNTGAGTSNQTFHNTADIARAERTDLPNIQTAADSLMTTEVTPRFTTCMAAAAEMGVQVQVRTRTGSGTGNQTTANTSSSPTTPVNTATCGTAHGAARGTAPSANLCVSGSTASTNISGSGPWTWTCSSLVSGNSPSICSAPLSINALCGTSSGVPTNSKPTTNLCEVGSTSVVSGTGPWTWACSTENSNGITASCSAPLPSPVNLVLTSGNSWTVPVGVMKIKVWAIGAGGGGAGAINNDATAGGGGGAGGVVYKTMTVTPGQSLTFSLGVGGMAGAGNAFGLSGGQTTITYGNTTITANGGAGGRYNTGVVASGGTGSGGDGVVSGGTGSGANSDTGGGGGGAIGGGNAVANGCNGGTGGQSVNVSGLFARLSVYNLTSHGVGPGCTGTTIMNGSSAEGFGNGGGGAGYYGGNGGEGRLGGGGGGGAGFAQSNTSITGNMVAGGNGGSGVVVITNQL